MPISPVPASSSNMGSPNGSTLETNATSVSSGSSSARYWNVLGHGGSHGQGSSDDSSNTRRRLDTFSSPEDDHARSAALLRFPCEQYHTGISNWINNLWEKSNIPTYNKPVRIHCKACSVSARLVFETRAKCQDFVARFGDDGIPCEIDSPFCNAKPVISVRQSKSIEVREIGKQFAPLWEVLAEQLTILFLEGDGGGAFIVPALDARSQVLSIRIRETALENQCFLEADSCLLLLHLTCVFLVKCCRKSPLKPARPMCDGRPFASPLFCRLAGRGTFSAVSVSDGFYVLRSL